VLYYLNHTPNPIIYHLSIFLLKTTFLASIKEFEISTNLSDGIRKQGCPSKGIFQIVFSLLFEDLEITEILYMWITESVSFANSRTP
jgi:hypothetical protein